jgi:four helix bundle protein
MPVWQKAMDLAHQIFLLTDKLPRNEDYGLTSQLRRAALSISANIAEGFGRKSKLDKQKFYIYSRGSAFETKNHLIYGHRVCYFSQTELNELTELLSIIIHDLNKINRSLD